MHRVSSLPRSSEYPAEAISVCDIKADKFYHKYGTHKVFCGMMISTIQEPEVRFSTQVLAGKLIRKCQKGECLVGVLFSMERCTQGIEMWWAQYLMNEFIQDCMEVQEFHYSWVLLLLEMILWKAPEGREYDTEVKN